jgi:hypothetical protein
MKLPRGDNLIQKLVGYFFWSIAKELFGGWIPSRDLSIQIHHDNCDRAVVEQGLKIQLRTLQLDGALDHARLQAAHQFVIINSDGCLPGECFQV